MEILGTEALEGEREEEDLMEIMEIGKEEFLKEVLEEGEELNFFIGF